jgi:LysM repeat protein
MDNDTHDEMEGFEEQIANNMRYSLEDEDVPSRKSLLDIFFQRKPLILGGIGVLILIVLIALFFGGGDTVSKKDLASLKAKLDQFEDRLRRFEGVEIRIASLEKHKQELEKSMAEAEKSKKILTEQYSVLSQRLDSLQKGKTPVLAKSKAQAPPKEPTVAGKKRYHKVRSGDTLYRIANKYGISVKELCRLNNIGQNAIIQPGQKLVVSPGS